jgi:ABC-type polysaccharide/polyol phosphate export permease
MNPVAGLIESFRQAVLHGRTSDPTLLLASVAVSVVCLVIGYGYFKSTETIMADLI